MAQRKRTLPIASAGGPPPTVTVNGTRWETLERIIGKSISPALRTELIDATNHFLSFAVFEHTAEPLDSAVERVTAVSRAANRFWRTLIEGGGGDAGFYANNMIEMHFTDSRMPRRHKIHNLIGIMTSFMVACDLAGKELVSEDNAEHRIGECWEGWIRRLTEILKQNKMPTSARKDAAKNKSGKASDFVRFIEELQKGFDSKFRRGTHSTSALAEAITLARRVAKDPEHRKNKTRNSTA
jgi:hypothetical protein